MKNNLRPVRKCTAKLIKNNKFLKDMYWPVHKHQAGNEWQTLSSGQFKLVFTARL
jgi:hypothetical protein